MGCRRAGRHSYGGLDNSGVRSAERILPELQHVEIGDSFPMTPNDEDTFAVAEANPRLDSSGPPPEENYMTEYARAVTKSYSRESLRGCSPMPSNESHDGS
jgi:hypothetical protein